MSLTDLCRAVLEHDERATKGPWVPSWSQDYFEGGANVVRIDDGTLRVICPMTRLDANDRENSDLIAHYRSACPTIAREYLRLAERLALAEAVCEGVAMYATVETDERLLMLHHKWLIAKDPQGEGEV